MGLAGGRVAGLRGINTCRVPHHHTGKHLESVDNLINSDCALIACVGAIPRLAGSTARGDNMR